MRMKIQIIRISKNEGIYTEYSVMFDYLETKQKMKREMVALIKL